MDRTAALALAPVLLLALGFVAWVLVDIARSPATKHLPRWAWAVLSILSIPLGGILYLFLGRSDER